MQAALGVMGVSIFLAVFFLLPETSHPGTRGMDKLRATCPNRMFVFVNPFKPLTLLRSPNILAVVGPFESLTVCVA